MEEKYNIGIIIDRTGSVVNEGKMIEESIKLMVEALCSNYPQARAKEMAVTYIGKEDFLLPQYNKDFNMQITMLGGSLKKADILEYKNIFELFEKTAGEKGVKKVFFFTDGYLAEGNWEQFIALLNEDKRFDEIERIVIGIGEGVNELSLKKFSSAGRVFQYKDVYSLI